MYLIVQAFLDLQAQRATQVFQVSQGIREVLDHQAHLVLSGLEVLM